MAPSGWGVDPTMVGGIAKTGTSSEDVRKVWGALYTPGVISGAVVTPSASALSYSVSAGVVAIKMATGEVVMAPVPSGTVPTTSVASGTRRDIVYAKQSIPTEGDSLIELGVAATLPARAVALGTFTVSAGNTKASQFVRSASVNYSIPYGSAGAALHYWRDTSNSQITGPTSDGHGSFYLPTDRKIVISIDATLSSSVFAPGYNSNGWTEARYAPYIDGERMCTWFTPPLTGTRATYHYENYFDLAAGEHTVYLGFDRQAGPAYPVRHFGEVDRYSGTNFVVRDAGVIV